ncbi:ABC transporter substrate-binding protein [Gracilibacillus timonensis]|uniref:ABC transporter substrate-binding protein n=1 Tax=Gracilibacillus timonensis TaxID=1816696 RepID=UPI000824A1F0|nr:iron-siderophore ABC transporter substrate-binding protein [Gracilibacillus timonensis]
MQTRRKTWILGGLLALLLILVACSQETDSMDSSDREENAEDVREVTHAMGTTTIEGNPKKIVTLYQGATDSMISFGITPVGAVESWQQQPMYDYLKDDLEGVTYVGQETQPNLEEINKLEPDLIVASKVRHEEIYDQLSAIAPTVMEETVFAFKDTIHLIGEATGEQNKAEEILTEWNDRVTDFQNKAETEFADTWPYHVSVLNFRADHARIYLTGFAGSILQELGFQPPKQLSDDTQDIIQLTDKESIPEMNADVFYYFIQDEAAETTYDEWTEHPLWQELDAVQSDQVYQVDEITWNLGGGIHAANLMLDDIYDRLDLEK